MPALEPNATVARIESLENSCLFRLWVKPDWTIDPAKHTAGQFVRIGVPQGEASDKKELRAMSYAGFDVAENTYEFYMVNVEGGTTSPRLAALEPGARMYCEEKVAGHFTLPHNPPSAELVMVGSGAGIAPFVSMLRSGGEVLDAYERVVVVHTVRELHHLGFGAEIAALVASDARFRYVPVVTRSEARFECKDGHCPLRGRLPQHLEEGGDFERAAEMTLDPARQVWMLCGNPDMIKDVTTVLEGRGFTRHKKRDPGTLVNERYW